MNSSFITSRPGGEKIVVILCTIENNKAMQLLCTSVLFSSCIADVWLIKRLC